jgi:hypothetical protein
MRPHARSKHSRNDAGGSHFRRLSSKRRACLQGKEITALAYMALIGQPLVRSPRTDLAIKKRRIPGVLKFQSRVGVPFNCRALAVPLGSFRAAIRSIDFVLARRALEDQSGRNFA